MKKLLSILAAALLVFSLAGCNQSKLKNVTLQIEDSGILSQYAMEANGDVVQTITQTTTMDCTGFVEEQFAIIEEAAEEYKTIYNAIEGVTYTVEITDTAMIEILVIDASNQDTIKTLSDQGLMPVETGDYISLEKTVESMCAEGWTVSEADTDK